MATNETTGTVKVPKATKKKEEEVSVIPLDWTKFESPYDMFIYIQRNIRVGKTKFNSFSKFWFRSVENIYTEWKLLGVPLSLVLSDEAIELSGKVFIEATATIKDSKGNIVEFAKAQAELGAGKAGMSSEQATGSASSYARKYALNGLFLLDDSVDPDEEDSTKGKKKSGSSSTATTEASEEIKIKIKELQNLIRGNKEKTEQATKLLAGRSILKLTIGELNEIIKSITST